MASTPATDKSALTIFGLVESLWGLGGTDILLTTNVPPLLRVDGQYVRLPDTGDLDGAAIRTLLSSVLTKDQMSALTERQELDFSFTWADKARVRCNAFWQRSEPALALRIIPKTIPSFDELGLPQAARDLAGLSQGLVLVTGPTGAGKSTTLAAMIDAINTHRAVHVVTIEDPIEYVHDHKLSAVNQREVGVDTHSFQAALRSALREDPDVLLVGEMRDLESIQMALTLAETGHLVFSTLHTNDTAQAVDRLVDVFPSERQAQIRVQLAATLRGIVYQRLLPKVGGGQIAAYEVLVAISAVRNLIREGKSNQLRNVVATQQGEGMQTLEQALSALVVDGVVELDDAIAVSAYPKEIGRQSLVAVPDAPVARGRFVRKG